MAFTQPRTWVAGEVPTAVLLNAQIRDNNNELALHAHTGGSGSGSSALGGTIGLTHIDFRDAAAPTGAGGTITRLYSSGSQVGRVEPGGTAAIFSTSGHEHSIGTVQYATNSSGTPTGTGTLLVQDDALLVNTFAFPVGTVVAGGGSGSRALVVAGGCSVAMHAGASPIVEVRFNRDGTAMAGSLSKNIPPIQAGTIGRPVALTYSTVLLNEASATSTFEALFYTSDTTASTHVYGRWIFVREVKQS